MTYREACDRLWVLPGTSHELVLRTLEERGKEVFDVWRKAKDALIKAEDAVVELSEVKRAIEKGEER